MPLLPRSSELPGDAWPRAHSIRPHQAATGSLKTRTWQAAGTRLEHSAHACKGSIPMALICLFLWLWDFSKPFPVSALQENTPGIPFY